LAVVRGEERIDRPIPAALVADGEVRGAREVEQVKLHLLGCLGESRGGRRGLVDGEQDAVAEVSGEGVPMREGRVCGVGELRGLEVKLAVGSWRSGWAWSGGSSVTRGSSGKKEGWRRYTPVKKPGSALYRRRRGG